MRVLSLLVIVGCRFGFDSRETTSDGATSDGPAADALADAITCSHDEDGDGVLDCIDLCPFVIDAQADDDGDGVGDACDPDPGATNQLVAFVPFTAPGVLALTGDDTFQEAGEFLHLDGTGRTVGQLAVAVADVDVVIGGRINASSNGERQLAIFPDPGNNQAFFYSDLYQLSGPATIHVAQYTGTTYTPVSSTTIGSIPTGAFTLQMRARAATGIVTTLVTTQTATSSAPVAYTGSSGLSFVFSLLDIDVEYIAVISAP